MRYEVLGPLRVVDNYGSSFISARKVEILLATLLTRTDRPVMACDLMHEIWGDKLPRQATAGLYVYVSELRKFLSPAHRPGNRIVTRPPGYMLSLGSDEMDANSFLSLVDRGRARVREGALEEAAECFERALALWRGPAFDGIDGGPMIESFTAWLSEARMECTEMLTDVQLSLGRHRELIGRLYSLIAEFPLRETFHRQLMLALYRSDRKADALAVYHSARQLLHNELGLEPCRALRDVQRAILTADDGLLHHDGGQPREAVSLR